MNVFQVPISQALYALNGMIVGLGEVTDPNSQVLKAIANGESTDSVYIYSTLENLHPKNVNCVGLGIVRAIDVTKRTLYLCTPIPENVLRTVNLLIRGSAAEFPVTGHLKVCRT
ncbi:hypothetical protein HDU67_003398 [Dinochytrium kinnereticum]|nr:hypothetical protein HDU67_003398 [Dinochytrium kinnereticum]